MSPLHTPDQERTPPRGPVSTDCGHRADACVVVRASRDPAGSCSPSRARVSQAGTADPTTTDTARTQTRTAELQTPGHPARQEGLTPGVPVEEERVLQLEVQVLGDGLRPVLHAQPVHDGEAVLWRGRPGKAGDETFSIVTLFLRAAKLSVCLRGHSSVQAGGTHRKPWLPCWLTALTQSFLEHLRPGCHR